MSYKLSIETTAILLTCANQLKKVAEHEHKRAREQGLDIQRSKGNDFCGNDGQDDSDAVAQLLNYLFDTSEEIITITKELS